MNNKEKALIEAKANVLKALGHPTRLWMAEQLAGGERCVCELAESIDADFSTASIHGMNCRMQGTFNRYYTCLPRFSSITTPACLRTVRCFDTAVIKATMQTHIDLLN